MNLKLSTFLLLFVFVFAGYAQETEVGPYEVGTLEFEGVVTPLASRINELTFIETKGEIKDGRYSKIRTPRVEVVPGKGLESDYLSENPDPLTGKIPGRAATAVWDAGYTFSNPTDPALAVGPDHVFVVWNTAFAIFDKDGNELVGPTSPNPAIFPQGGCCDLTVSYDSAAQRWVISFLVSAGGGARVAVSQGPDPINDGWFTYFAADIDDYNKLSVWSDGYYMTNNGAQRVVAMDRDAMIAGDTNPSFQSFTLPGLATFGFASPQVLNVTDSNMPAVGNAPVVMFQDNAYAGVTVDHVKFWSNNVDFDNPGNSTMSAPQEIPVTPFTSIFDGGSFVNLTQPNPGGGTLDALQGIIMNQAQFRKFPTHNSAVFNHVIDVDPTGGKRAAVRWYEFRQATDGAPWTLFQEGTYEAPDNKHAWNASIMVDGQGNMGMGYTAMSIAGQGNVNLGSYYTGRFVNDPLGTMTISEEPIVLGDGVIVGSRYGDYSKIDIDPADDQTFYFANEVHTADTPNSSQRAANVGRFKIAPDADNDMGIVNIVTPEDGALSSTETVTVTVRNFGTVAQSNVSVSFTIDGGTPVTEVIAGTIPPSTNVDYTFTATANLSIQGQTYTICASTGLAGDEIPDNDEFCKDVSHLNDNDTGVVAVTAPTSGSGLGDAEEIIITIENFGAATQTSIPVFYTLDGGTAVQETYTGSIVQGATDTYTFTATVDLSELGDYTIVAGTELAGDADESNDDFSGIISNTICQPVSNCSDDDGVSQIELADQDINTNCGPDGYSDDTDIVFNFVLGDNPFDGTVRSGFADNSYAIWIDFDDSDSFEASELIANGAIPSANSDVDFTVDFSDLTGVTMGMHRMRVRGSFVATAGNVLDPCDDLAFGRTNDFTANISGILGIENNGFAQAEFTINSADNEIFDVNFNSTTSQERIELSVYNTLGQNVAYYVLDNNGSGFTKTINMSYVSSGVYFVKIGNSDLNRVKRIIVK